MSAKPKKKAWECKEKRKQESKCTEKERKKLEFVHNTRILVQSQKPLSVISWQSFSGCPVPAYYFF
jgi:hypothetical protein